jgi:hypothetical protein
MMSGVVSTELKRHNSFFLSVDEQEMDAILDAIACTNTVG